MKKTEKIITLSLITIFFGCLSYFIINSEKTINEIGADKESAADQSIPVFQSNTDSIFRLSENQVDKILDDHDSSTAYYGLYVSGDVKIGYIYITRDIDIVSPNETYYTEKFEMKIFTNVEGNLDSTTIISNQIFSTISPYELLREETNTIQYGTTMTMVMEPIEDKYIITTLRGSNILNIDSSDRKIVNYGLRDYLINQYIISKLSSGENFPDIKSVNTLQDGKESLINLYLSNTKDYFLEGGSVRCYTLEIKTDDFVSEIVYNEYGKEILVNIGDVMQGRLENELQAKDIDQESELLSIGIIKMLPTKPEIDYDTTKRKLALIYEIHGEYNNLFIEDSHQEVFEADGKRYIKSHKFNMNTVSNQFKIDSLLSYSSSKYPINNSEIIDFANSAVNLEQEDSMKINDLLDFVYHYIEYSFEEKWHSTVYEIIKSKKGVCADNAYLFNVLSRSLGIPCKEVVGMAYIPSQNSWGAHAWNEVLINNKWYSIDPTWNQWQPRVSTLLSNMGHLKMKEYANPNVKFSLSLSSISLEGGSEVKLK